MEFLKENLIFLREFLQDFDSTGSFCPTSKWAAQALIKPLRGDRRKKRILEAGPGTGSVTVHILSAMRADDELVICELNPRFMAALKQNLANNVNFQRHKDRISFFQGAVQELPDSGKFDLIVCAIPFLNLDVEIVRDIFKKFRALSTDQTALTYYEYIGLRRLGKVVSLERRKRLTELETYLTALHEEGRTSRSRIWLNMLPINVYQVENIAVDGAAA